MDGFSRNLLRCEPLRRPLSGPVQKVFESTFREYGLPQTIRTDNGPPFSTLAPGGLSRLAVWRIRLGIRPERSVPGRPDQNGRHERMHSTLKAETARPPRSRWRAQQRSFQAFRQEYNHERPHEALAYATPASQYQSSLRLYPDNPRTRNTRPTSASNAPIQWSHLVSRNAVVSQQLPGGRVCRA
jgi:transposase InsO family protein